MARLTLGTGLTCSKTKDQPKSDEHSGRMKILHVNRHVIASNKKNGTRLPPLVAKLKSKRKHDSSRSLKGLQSTTLALSDSNGRVVARLVYRPDKPLNCGATAWLETDLAVVDEDAAVALA